LRSRRCCGRPDDVGRLDCVHCADIHAVVLAAFTLIGGCMDDWKKLELAFDLIQNAEVIQEFGDYLLLKVDKETYLELNGGSDD
jgi:hypothetical protein